MQGNILIELEKRRQQNPEHFTKPIHVVADVHDNINDEWKRRLQQIKEVHNGDCIVLIPYHVKDCHWIGIFFKFLTKEQIEQAYLIDSLNTSEINPKKFQNELTEIYPNVVLQSKNYQRSDDLEQSAVLTVENLLKATEEACIQVPNANHNDLFEKENLKNMQQDFLSMPPCAERTITCLLFYLSLKSIDNAQILNYDIEIPDQIDMEIDKTFENMKEHLMIEQLNSKENDYSIAIVSTNITNKNWPSAVTELTKILKRIRPLDVHELIRLIRNVDEAANSIKNKNIILLMGFTGSGKSTMTHFLAGSQMIQVIVDEGYHILPIEVKNPDLKKVIISAKMRSETRYITPVTINYIDVHAITKGSVVLCDSPGFGDTAGAEVDIANGIGIIRAIKKCNSVKPVVLFSFKRIGDRCEGVKELAHILVGLIPNIGKHLNAFNYVFTKYPAQEEKMIHNSLKSVYRDLTDEETSDIGFISVLKDMIKKTQRAAQTLDPLTDSPGDMLDEFADSDAIQRPDEVFELSITIKSKAVVQQQIQQNQLAIISACERFDYLLVKYRLDQMKSLSNLLPLEFIKQIYIDCIQQVTKHLSNQYQNNISMFDRCLLDQTIINVEDIQQYQTCILNFKLIEPLRNDHLGKEIVHSSAFITHLNQQIECLCVDLKEKEFNDSFIKFSLNKIQLISQFFPDIIDTYKNICQFLLDNLQLIVSSFKNSVLSNKFDESANNIKKLYHAYTNLSDHLNSEHILATYTELRQYFFDYLNSNTQIIDKILTKNMLEKIDIDNLNNCICIFESIANTFALKPHISLNDIDKIYTNIQTQMIKYFNGIINKIDVEWKKENSFHNLEPYMEQLDLIRTIPIINTLTGDSYWKILEQLIGYIQESKRFVDEQLRILLKNEDIIQCDELIKRLSHLKGAQWIEKYRTGIYMDVINIVEQQLNQHIIILTDSLMKINLDLENVDKIEHVYKKILNIYQMKNIGQIIDNITENIEKITCWFKDITNNVFKTIQNTFNIEQSNTQGWLAFDFDKAEKAFLYLNVCKNISILMQSDCMLVLNNLENFIRNYSTYIVKEMKNCFDTMKEFENGKKEEIFARARLFTERLHEIKDLQATYPRTFSYFLNNKKILEYWKHELNEYLNELTDEMEKLKNTEQNEALNNKLIIAKAFSRLDWFIDDERKYFSLHQHYQKALFSRTGDTHKQLLDAIAKNDYQQVANEFQTLKSSNDAGEHLIKQAKRALIIGVENFMDETKILALSLENIIKKEQIVPIIENLKRLEKANQFVSEYVTITEEIEKLINEIKQLIEERMANFLRITYAAMKSNHFSDADENMNQIILIRNILGKYCAPNIAKQISELKESKSKVILDKIVEKYSEMNLNMYSLDPPINIFEKFDKVSRTNSTYYEALEKIKQTVFVKFRTELELAKSHKPPSLENDHIRNFECAIQYLPETMQNTLNNDLEHCKNFIVANIQENKAKLDHTLESNDIEIVKATLEEYNSIAGMKIYANRIKDNVRKKVQILTKNIIQHFHDYEINQAINDINKLYNYKVKLEKYVDGIEQSVVTVRIQIKTIFQEEYTLFTNIFGHDYKSEISNEIIKKVERSFNCLFEFMKFYFEQTNQPILTDMLPEDFIEKLTEINENILHYLSEQQKKNTDALESLDAESLKNCLDNLNQWKSLIISMKIYEQILNIKDSIVINIINTRRELKTYSQLLKLLNQQIENLHKELIEQELICKDTEEYEKQRNEFYQNLNKKLVFLQKVRSMFTVYALEININTVEQESIESLTRKIFYISAETQRLIEKFLSDSIWIDQDSKKFNIYYNNMISFNQIMKIKTIDISKDIERIRDKFLSKIQTWEQLAVTETNIEKLANYLIFMKEASNMMPIFEKEIKDRIDNVLKISKSRRNAPINIGKLGSVLQRAENGIGSSIIAEHKAFEGYSISIFHKKTQEQDIDYILKHLTGDEISKNRLKCRYDEFNDTYQSLINHYLKSNMDLNKLISDTIFMSGKVKLTSDSFIWDAGITTKIPTIVAHVLALWTLQNAENYFEADVVSHQNEYLLQPHSAQIISIFRMLGIGDKNEDLENNLVQIGTGEGKSIILGVTAVTLALLGFDVSCACYSEYLSNRDYRAFLPLFNSFGVVEYIHYGTFNKLCEAIINENGSVRERVEQFILKNSKDPLQNNQQMKCPKILLIDEVDVFFNQNFYGNIYTPSAHLRDPTITALINLIWKEKQSQLNLKKLTKSYEYQACCNRFPNWKLLINEAIKDLIFDVKNFQSHAYAVKQDRIGYIEQDNIIYNVTYGYKTLFAYYYEYEKGTISRESLEENIGFCIKCGSFSFAEIPRSFMFIIGVTGTLKYLSEPEKNVIQNYYKIKKNTFIPSLFGENKLRFVEKDDIKLEDESNYFNVIRREIDDQLIGRSNEKRSVLVVFESISKLKEFYESKALEPIKATVSYLTEEASSQEKDQLIKRATISGQITLLTSKFGRGTDFVCHDPKLSANGGIHVIQTFLSIELSEEVQIKGRTARQANHGSYSLILNYRDLERFHIKKDDINDIKKGRGIFVRLAGILFGDKYYSTVYEYLHDKRTDLFKIQYEDNMKYVTQAQKRHALTTEFLKKLNIGNVSFVQTFLVEENKGVEDHLNSRTVILMDATSSMTHLLHKCKTTVDVMVDRTSEILKDNDINPNSFQIQFVFYRNYNSRKEKILQTSSWETKPDNLRTFMNTIEVEGGWNNEAIEIALWHANTEHKREPITQVILIGDAPPNTREEVTKKRQQFGENYWKTTKFARATYYEDELTKLKSNDIPIHAFYVDKKAETAFQAIANGTNERCEMLDINSPSGSAMLTDLVIEEILRSTGGTKGNDLVDAYREKFGKSYT